MQETPLFRLAQEKNEVTKSPLKVVFKTSWRQLIQGTLIVSVTYTLFYTLATWSLTYATTKLGFSNQEYLFMLMGSIIIFALLIVVSSTFADKWGT